MAEATGVNVEPWQAILAVILTGITALVTAFFSGLKGVVTALLKRMERRAGADAHKAGVLQITQSHDTIDELKSLGYADRVLFFSGTNSGGIPAALKPYYVTCVEGWSNDGTRPERTYSGRLQVSHDPHYMRMIAEIIQTGMSVQTTATIPDGSLLKNLYTEEGVVQSLLFFLSMDAAELSFCSIASKTAAFTPAQVAKITVLISQIRGILGSPDDFTPKP